MSQSLTTVDVRDMLCAQALAVVAKAAERLQPGESLEMLYDTDDVKRDLLAWAKDRGELMREIAPGRLQLTIL